MPKKALLEQFSLNLGGMVISIRAQDAQCMFRVDSQRQYFSSKKRPDVVLRVHKMDILRPPDKEKAIFVSSGLWSLFSASGKYILYGKSDAQKPPDRQVVLSGDFRSGDIYLSPSFLNFKHPGRYPLEFPLDEILVIILLSLNKGALIHACGIAHNSRGILFAGSSGAGKSTIAGLYKKGRGAAILSDDRIIIRKDKGLFYIYGTPWHGDANVCSPKKVQLKEIHFLKHSKINEARKLLPVDALSRLVSSSFSPFWEKSWMNSTLGFCSELVQSVPCYELKFLPDKSILDYLTP